MQKVKKYWKGLEQLKVQSDIMDKLEQNEFVEKIPVEKIKIGPVVLILEISNLT